MYPKRIEIIKKIVENIGEKEIIVSNIGIPSKELYYVKDRERNFYMLGSMGLASSIGLGLALNCEDKVIVIDGDGSILMNLGSLSTIGYMNPKNYILVIIDNSAYGSTGNQKTHTSKNTNLEEIAKGCGLDAITTESLEEFEKEFKKALNEEKCKVIIAKAIPYNEKCPNIEIPPVVLKYRFMEAIKKN
ncbi:thiamine pyrophosphate protein domain protein TPP-binding protein [Methanocaldococcus sp. FS406-22]|uniref:sulfopyruvate decarboxylase subunit beta n=1 Tax=Methanocaldococcus sp. (strain FS406-22) TaxID=644281 RepID=UPI0001BF4FEF|nr:sulfopyruvate decarboxylase subunit beta [Methanocaldococcus sp. FS406-22]ADC69181.1 thiamine pyrophosphate protein domain protein TPP-binding protein [Methanocaldococcus sp. FS406-22]